MESPFRLAILGLVSLVLALIGYPAATSLMFAGGSDSVVVIGVTGHRVIAAHRQVAERVAVLVDSLVTVANRGSTPGVRLAVVSCLAEGADRIVAGEILSRRGAELVAVLPFPVNEYLLDFPAADSRRQFTSLLARASQVVIMPPADSRGEAYRAASRYVVDHCDVLIALWDGTPAVHPGGTADTLAYALARNLAVHTITVDRNVASAD